LSLVPSRLLSPLAALCLSLYATRSCSVKPSCAMMKLMHWSGRLQTGTASQRNGTSDAKHASSTECNVTSSMTARQGWPIVLTPVVRLVQVCGAGDASGDGTLHAGVALYELPASSMRSVTKSMTQQTCRHTPQCAGTLQGRTVAHRRSSRNLPFHSPQVSQLGKVPTWYMPQSHGSASRCTCVGSTAALQHRCVLH
jgi:hypothetical protein